MISQETTECSSNACSNKFCWSAVIVGALIGMGIGFLFNLLDNAIGLSMLKIQEGIVSVSIGGLIGMAIGVIVSMFLAGSVAGHLSQHRCGRSCVGFLYGFTTWCVSLVIAVFIALPLGHYVNAYSHFISKPGYILSAATVTPESNANSNENGNTQEITVTDKDVQKIITKREYAIFFFFLLGALSSCAGACYVIACRCCDRNKCEPAKV